ncbi:MAG: YtxH domain-containing protein [Dehalococcoidales bacterium]|jgi:gas vesicle protein|nr:YtxH domain-containing protein [Dehalococcoidales bacterium]
MKNGSGMSGGGGLFLGLLIGALAGGIAALLLAPKSGKETREYLKTKATDAQHVVQEKAGDVKNRFSRMKEDMQARAEEEAESIKR